MVSSRMSFVLCLLLISINMCSRRDKSNFKGESLNSKPDTIINNMEINHSYLQGIWWSRPDDVSAVFNIIDDSLYYTEEQQSPFYVKVNKDTFSMSRGGEALKFQIRKLTSDSLVLLDLSLNRISRFYKPRK